MKNSLLLLLFYTSLNAQTFTLDNTNNFPNISLGQIKLADVDGDNDLDVFFTGNDYNNGTNLLISRLYLNNGIGNFTESSSTFLPLDNSTVDFADIDGDSDLDLVISGRTVNIGEQACVLYRNDGSGIFTELTSENLISVSGSVEFADIDGDNDNDLLIVGDLLAALYINDGSGNFSSISSSITGTTFGDIEFEDIDGDLDLDLLVVGDANGTTNRAKLYRNNGLGIFTEITGSNLFLATFSSVSFGDIDGDLDSDLIISGQLGTEIATKLYLNDGSGNFTEDTSIVIEQITLGEVLLEDINDDNALDIIMTGSNTSNTRITKVYINDSNGNFTELSQTFEGLGFLSKVEVGDIDGDGDKDIFCTGVNTNGDTTTNLYTNNLYTLSNNNFISNKAKVYPNPTQTYIHIETTSTINLYTIYDISGRVVLKEKFKNQNDKKLKINTSSLDIGHYIIQIELSDSTIFHKRIIKT